MPLTKYSAAPQNNDIEASHIVDHRLYVANKTGIQIFHYPGLNPYHTRHKDVGILDMQFLRDTFYYVGYRAIGKIAMNSLDTVKRSIFKLKRAHVICSLDSTHLLVGGDKGVYKVNTQNLQADTEQYLDNIHVQKLYPYRGFIWLCTKGNGLLLMDKKFHTVEITRVPSSITNDIKILGDTLVLLFNQQRPLCEPQKRN